MRRRGRGGGIRAEYLAELERLEHLYGGPEFGHPFAAQITALKAGKPVIVRNGYEVDLLPPYSGPFCLEADGTVTAVVPIYQDPTAAVRTAVGYRRPDGSVVGRTPTANKSIEVGA